MVAPDTLPQSVTLYLHGLGYGQWFWHFDSVANLDYARELADLGHASVIIDRLGYGGSSHPDGNQICVGEQADIADQIAAKLRSGFSSGLGTASFSKVALAGHSAGGAIAQIAAYSFPQSFDALLVMSYAEQGASPDALAAFLQGGFACATGGGPNNYTRFGQTDADFDHLMFNTPRALSGQLPVVDSGPTASTVVIAAVNPLRNPDPCGDDNSLAAEIVLSQLLLTQVKVPTLLVCGDADAIFPRPACDLQALHFPLTPDFTSATILGGGHALTIGSTAGVFRQTVSDWLTPRGF